MLAIFTLTRDREQYTRTMLEQLKRETLPFDHYIVDNGSTDETKAFLATLDCKVALLEENTGIWGGVKWAMGMANNFYDYDLVLKLDNDLEFPQPGWLTQLVETYERNNFQILSPFVEGICDGAGGPQRLLRGNPQRIATGEISETNHVGGACLLTTPELYQKEMIVGFKSQGWDTWFCEGRKCGIVEGTKVKHDTKKQEAEMPEYYERKVKESEEIYKV